MESDVVRQRTRVEEQTETTEKRRSKERRSVREPVLETRHRKRTPSRHQITNKINGEARGGERNI